MAEQLTVEVAYTASGGVDLVAVALPPGSTVQQALEASGLLERHPELDLRTNPVGIYSRVVGLATLLRSHDRIELYRPLLADPLESRRLRARKKQRAG